MAQRTMIVAQYVTVFLIGFNLILTFTCINTTGSKLTDSSNSNNKVLTINDSNSDSNSNSNSNDDDGQPYLISKDTSSATSEIQQPQSSSSVSMQSQYYFYEYKHPHVYTNNNNNNNAQNLPPKVQLKFSGEIGTVRPNQQQYHFNSLNSPSNTNSIFNKGTTTITTKSPYKVIEDDDEEEQQNLYLGSTQQQKQQSSLLSSSSSVETPNINYYEYLSAPIMNTLTLASSESSSAALPRLLISLYKKNNNIQAQAHHQNSNNNNDFRHGGHEQVLFQPLQHQQFDSINSHDESNNKKKENNNNQPKENTIVLDDNEDDLLNSQQNANNRNDYDQNASNDNNNYYNNNNHNNQQQDEQQEQKKYSNSFSDYSSSNEDDDDHDDDEDGGLPSSVIDQDAIHNQYFIKTKPRDTNINLGDDGSVLKVLKHNPFIMSSSMAIGLVSSSEDDNTMMMNNINNTTVNDSSLTLLLHNHQMPSPLTNNNDPEMMGTTEIPSTIDIQDKSGLIIMTPTAASNLIADVTSKYGEISDSTSIPGMPGIDYPILGEIPYTGFDCQKQRYKGFFADLETKCQAWHYCDFTDGHSTFLCPNGTLFSQTLLTCDWWFNVKCEESQQLYVLNERLYRYIKAPKLSFPEDYHGPQVDDYLLEQLQLGLLPKIKKKVKDKIVLQANHYKRK